MFYLLNFRTHTFISCDGTDAVDASVESLLKTGCKRIDFEVVNAYGDLSRFTLDEFDRMFKDNN